MRHLYEVFQYLDQDKTGYLSMDELTQGLAMLGSQHGAPKKAWGPNKRHEKGSHFINKLGFYEVSQFPETFFCLGSFSKMEFRRRPFNQKSLVFRKNPRTHLEVQGSFGDEGTFQECQKSWILKIPLFRETENWRPGVYFDAKYVSAHSRRTKTPSIAIWGKIFIFCQFFSFF